MKNRITLRRSAFALAAAALVATIGPAYGAGEETLSTASAAAIHASAGANVTVESRVRDELSVVMMDLIQSGAFGATSPQQIALDVNAPAQKVSNLGLLVDSKNSGSDGLRVLAVTPGGNAERIGLRAGDTLVALNGSSLAATDGAGTLRRTVDTLPDGGRLDFDVRRDGQAQRLGGASASMYLPAMHLSVGGGTALASNADAGSAAPLAASGSSSYRAANPPPAAVDGCGRISDFDVAPRGQQLHAARIITIDGVTPGPSGSKAYRVAAGSHVVRVGERIESRYLAFNDRQRNAPLQGGYKEVTVDVSPNTTYLIAARLNEDQRDNPINGAYWDPVMWKDVSETCR